jgi:hypothetical protein
MAIGNTNPVSNNLGNQYIPNSSSQGAIGNGLPNGLTDEHLDQPDDNGVRKFNQQGITYLQAQIPVSPTLGQQFMSMQPSTTPQQQGIVQTPPPMSLNQLSKVASGLGMTGLAGATSSGIGGLLAAL